ncbi:MAG: hypothetical protein HUK08_05110 [Bacteroidaceae bacterium]|nr:hypothetical protein [Bacteroidaceae bacterium]
MKKEFVILLLCLFPLLSFAQVMVKQEIDSVEIFIGEQAHIKLSVRAKKGQDVVMPVFKQSEYLTPGIEVLDSGRDETTDIDDNTTETVREYTITAFEDTLYYIPPMTVKVGGKDYKGRNLALKVLTCEVDTLHPERFFPPQDVQDPPFEWREWWDLILMMFVALLLSGLAYFFYRRLKANKPINIKLNFRKKLSPYEQAVRDINHLKDKGMSHSEDQKDYYSSLTDVLRNYIESRFGFNAKEMITSEIIAALQKEDKATMVGELKQLFETADLVKFAKFQVSLNENDTNLTNALQFVTTTKQEEKKEEEKPKKSEAERQIILWRRIYKVVISILCIAATALTVYAAWQLIMII